MMNDGAMIELRRDRNSVARGFALLFAVMLAVTALAYFGSLNAGKPWPLEYIVSLLIPFTIASLATWYGFVPPRVRYSRDDFEFTSHFFGVSTLPFAALRKWGFGRQTIFLKFARPGKTQRVIQIAPAFYPKDEINALLALLRTNFAEKEGGF